MAIKIETGSSYCTRCDATRCLHLDDRIDLWVEAEVRGYSPARRATWGWDGGEPGESESCDVEVMRVVVDDGCHPTREIPFEDLPDVVQRDIEERLRDAGIEAWCDAREAADEWKADARREGDF